MAFDSPKAAQELGPAQSQTRLENCSQERQTPAGYVSAATFPQIDCLRIQHEAPSLTAAAKKVHCYMLQQEHERSLPRSRVTGAHCIQHVLVPAKTSLNRCLVLKNRVASLKQAVGIVYPLLKAVEPKASWICNFCTGYS